MYVSHFCSTRYTVIVAIDILDFKIAFEMMGIIAVITNCALVFLSPEVQKLTSDLGTTILILIFVLIEVQPAIENV